MLSLLLALLLPMEFYITNRSTCLYFTIKEKWSSPVIIKRRCQKFYIKRTQ